MASETSRVTDTTAILENLDRRPADLRLLAIGVDEIANEPPERTVVAALIGGVDAIRAEQTVGQWSGEPPLRRAWRSRRWYRPSTASGCGRRIVLECPGSRPYRSPRRRTAPVFPGSEKASEYAIRIRRSSPPSIDGSRLRSPRRRAACRGRAEGVEHLLALGVAQLVQGQLVVVAHEVRPLAGDVEARPLRRALASGGRRRGPATGRSCCMPMKSNCMLRPSPSEPPKNFFWSL